MRLYSTLANLETQKQVQFVFLELIFMHASVGIMNSWQELIDENKKETSRIRLAKRAVCACTLLANKSQYLH